ncbi:MAG: tRNA preQ1(34) S-adenosylmethionine ribosyltransferase-isomerase QueA [Alphaproteobacteria bacterium]|nr:tRNA preQ1(34) S-adenosylmethionine ribosyltransferase-isomerase QueA [Alphaproteobacteria bacterium]
MRVNLFDFELPEQLIALRPAVPRDAARCLIVHEDGLQDRGMSDLPTLLGPGDLLVFNDTRVIPAALKGTRTRRDGQKVFLHLNLHQRLADNVWRAFIRPLRRVQPGDEVIFGEDFSATVLHLEPGEDATLQFNVSGTQFEEAILRFGAMPLPPYIGAKRPVDAQDMLDYQTVFARVKGSVAAPTASLHFTENLVKDLKSNGINHCFITLHVGAGTFLPVKSEDTERHKMHAEWGCISEESAQRINAAREAGHRVVAVGTTALRLLESAADEDGMLSAWSGDTRLFILPGYRFRIVDALITNFHLPKSTLFMLVSAFCGRETMHRAYQHAIEARYRFFSYGDGSLLFRTEA